MSKWYASDILDNDKFGIVTEDNGIVVGWGSNLSHENAKKIADRHNFEMDELRERLEK